jgi:DNA invertase Pin-like site-specific DNA recombinase
MIPGDALEIWTPTSSEKISPSHLQRLAVVYVRQSTAQQVLNHGESTRLQYGLVSRAQTMGWPKERVLVIDDDLGVSAASSEGRTGFRRLVSEVGLGHVGMILGVEMSRLARSSKDWHQLLEICALFGTLISDLDGVYDPADYNGRLLLGLKGTMSEAELHIIKQRMHQGKLNKAHRGELTFPVPTGYVRQPSGEVVFDPDEQVQQVVELVFRKFEELGTLHALLRYLVKHEIRIGIRVRQGLGKRELQWHPPNRAMLQNLLKHPIYAGAYAYGRRQVDGRAKMAGRPSTGRRVRDPKEWHALIKDRLPAYISWEQYERNVARLKANRARAEEVGAVRHGVSVLAGLVVCARCERRMSVIYGGQKHLHSYICSNMASDYGGEPCQQLSGKCLDEFVSRWVLEALKPATLELSLEAAKNLESEREQLDRLWRKRLERAEYEAERAGRQYHLVEPENRLVARELEREWERKLAAHQKLREDYHRFSHGKPRVLSEEESEAIRKLAKDIPALWEAPTTTRADRKEIVRQVVDKVVIDVEGASERVRVKIHWAGGTTTEGVVIRPVAKLEQLSYYPKLCERVRALAAEGLSTKAIAERLNAEGYRPPKRSESFGRQGIRDLMHRLGLTRTRYRSESPGVLDEDEWWLPELAQAIDMPNVTLYHWIRRGWVRARQRREDRRWVVWADETELKRLHRLHRLPKGDHTRRLWVEPEGE